ncbi:BTB domain-containing protein [Caenorhabditis elegans]|uniref:BTB domain-containing protein n=1 Tax=Caenorhabditis elegans TaxID=6239 RepID=O16630_CAEEL|nr:BTB domain-containing protein [Caenorhabditis elegans]CCD70877.1 BTB domain-containing protein [Caenorhabditis elegans]|eukprot:NP_494291.1 Uncharacterized protein CELE_K02F6.8 [Caenorhabditis elegans]
MIRLDVGGRKFSTNRSTLTKFDGYFRKLPKLKDESSTTTRIVIDRSPKHFETVLNFMRDGSVDLPESLKHLRQLLREAIFYGLEKLIECCKQAMATSEIVAVAPEEPKSPDTVVPLLSDYQVNNNDLQHMVRICGDILRKLGNHNILSLPSVYTFDDYVNYLKSVTSAIIPAVYARISNWRHYFKKSDEAHSFVQKIIQWIYAMFAGFNRLPAAVHWELALLLCVLMVFQTC